MFLGRGVLKLGEWAEFLLENSSLSHGYVLGGSKALVHR